VNEQQRRKVESSPGFIAALDQSGGSTPKALELYGVGKDEYSNDEDMFTLMHQMRTRMMTSPAFDGERILGVILFEQTMDREVEGVGTADYLWTVKQIVPFVKVDQGLAEESNGVQLMKAMPALDALVERAVGKGVFGTKMRSVVKLAHEGGIKGIVEQQFEVGQRILAGGLVPIIEPEVDIHSPQKAEAEAMLRSSILESLDQLPSGDRVILKLTLPDEDDFYAPLVDHPRVLRVVALSGGYSREEANARLARNRGVIASFSRALTEGLSATQSDDEFNGVIDRSIADIYAASVS